MGFFGDVWGGITQIGQGAINATLAPVKVVSNIAQGQNVLGSVVQGTASVFAGSQGSGLTAIATNSRPISKGLATAGPLGKPFATYTTLAGQSNSSGNFLTPADSAKLLGSAAAIGTAAYAASAAAGSLSSAVGYGASALTPSGATKPPALQSRAPGGAIVTADGGDPTNLLLFGGMGLLVILAAKGVF